MKKFLIAAIMLLGSISLANAERFSLGATVSGGVFSADGASELFSGDHSGNRSTTDVTKSTADEGEDAEAAVMMGSIFFEAALTDQVSLGVNYVPHSMDSETVENIQNMHAVATGEDTSSVRNTVKVSFEDLTTIYALANINDNVYAKVGYVEVELITDENLGTGGAYGNTTLDGYSIALGYSMDMADGMFARFEASYMDLDGATLTNDNDSTKSVKADGISGYGAGISIGKSF
ncbi:hypothetical protein [Candidatus Pelagibacter sp. RS39]|uniref:hypothetical protein n=1 Tax=Candidatus Pelagibacter sp. RS39 TaxID=1977864 RepID=UPI000A154978|nr:hypothetical protein [Candidatus Pelagibacter sp. RS39]ARJ48184.1 hypothetical protein B5L73_05205 [Candidatus Pelagibacter sp. RS39]